MGRMAGAEVDLSDGKGRLMWAYEVSGDQVTVTFPNADGKTKTVIKATLGSIDSSVKRDDG